MKNFKYENSRSLNIKRIPMIDNRSISRELFHLILHYLLVASAAILCYACKEPIEVPVVTPPPVKEDENELILRFSDKLLNDKEFRSLDIMIYDSSGLKALLYQVHLEDNIQNQYSFLCTDSEKIIVIIQNCPNSLKKAAIQKLDSCLSLEFSFDDSQKLYPLKYGIFQVEALENNQRVLLLNELQSVNSKIVITQITNNLDNYELLENPRVRLRNLSSLIAPFKKPPDYPTEFIETGEFEFFPYDIGLEAQTLETELICYPNYSQSYGLCTQLEFCCEMLGKTESFLIDLPPLARDAITEIELFINGPEDFDYNFGPETLVTLKTLQNT